MNIKRKLSYTIAKLCVKVKIFFEKKKIEQIRKVIVSYRLNGTILFAKDGKYYSAVTIGESCEIIRGRFTQKDVENIYNLLEGKK